MAIAHDYVTQRGGAERVVLAMLQAFPGAELHTLLYEPSSSYPEFSGVNIKTSWLDRIPFFRRHHRLALPLLPFAARSMKVDADVVVASSSGWAHGVRTTGKILVYCYSPARWLYEKEQYLGTDAKRSQRALLGIVRRPLILWDRHVARRAAGYLSISSVVRERVQRAYGIESEVLPAPHSLDASGSREPVDLPREHIEDGFYLCVSRLLPYKYVDVVVDAFDSAERRLVVVGVGPELTQLRRRASDRVAFRSDLTDAQMRWLYDEARAVVSASHEDFGLTPLEAGSFGKPAVVPRAGGYLDTVLEGINGVFFEPRTPSALRSALQQAEAKEWVAEEIVAHARKFSTQAFSSALQREVQRIEARGSSDAPVMASRAASLQGRRRP
ncbi:glycosyltransferase [Candidatus Blastococcus massiliensis]|uniref:glycosyltransferase n=1 Tax=Candidatus Blastococcus massiliensis TaxID=1470358 RepID=UPI0018CBFAED|nr:glycosyltransferase [Candidatus Blastococcus massiliensis]